MAEIVLFHHAQGPTPGVEGFADILRRAGHVVHLPDLFEGHTFDTLDEGIAHFQEVGGENLLHRARTAVGALLDSGCRRIALIGGTAENACPDADRESRPETTSTMRTRGYVLAHEERGLQVDWRLVRNADWVQSGGRDAVAGLLDDPDAPRPDAVMCLNDALAIGVIHELQRRGVRVPQDMQVIGFDNVPDAEYCMPGLTTIDPHVDDYARHAVDMLIARIEGSADPFRTYVTSYDLVRRASTC